MNQYLRATLRFWWLLLAGLAAAMLVAVLLLYHVKSLSPLKLVQKAKPSYVAGTQLLVDSPNGPYFRADSKQVPQAPVSRSTSKSSSHQSTTQTTTTSSSAPALLVTDTKSLVSAANLFPLFIESDAVAAIRTRLIGNVRGSVIAKALFSLENPNKFRPSPLPVMQIVATAPRPKAAVLLTTGTARAFNIWLTRRQQRAHIPADQRIVVRVLNVPTSAIQTGGPSRGLPLIAALAVLAAFVGIAIVADRTWPRRQARQVERVAQAPSGEGSVAEYRDLTVATAPHTADPPS